MVSRLTQFVHRVSVECDDDVTSDANYIITQRGLVEGELVIRQYVV